jgi:TIR domain
MQERCSMSLDRHWSQLNVCFLEGRPAYDSLGDKRNFAPSPSTFAVDSALLRALSSAFNDGDFVDSTSAYELDQAAESFSRQLRLHRKRMQRDFDVFLSYNLENRGEVRTIANHLKARGLLPWLDEEELPPGLTWQAKLEQDIEAIGSCAVIVGPSGVGPWQRREVEAALQLFVERGRAIVPVILPSCSKVPDLPLFLRSFAWVDYRSLDPDPIEQLERAIAGQRRAT